MDRDPLDQQLDDAGLLGGEQLIPKRIQAAARLSRTSASVISPAWARAAFHVPATISGWRNTGAELLDDRRLDLARGHAADRARSGTMFQHRLTDIVAVEPVALAGVRRRERGPVRAEQQPLQQRGRVGAGAGGALLRGLSFRMACTRSHVSRSMMASCSPG